MSLNCNDCERVKRLAEALEEVATLWEYNQRFTESQKASMLYDARCIARRALTENGERK